jgi:Zinc carboxypeptidase
MLYTIGHMLRSAALCLALVVAGALAFQSPSAPAPAGRLSDPFATGWMLADTNGDGIADFINGKIVVPAQPTAAENASAANFAARLGFGSTGLTPPLVVKAAHDMNSGPRIWVGIGAVPTSEPAYKRLTEALKHLEKGEGGVFDLDGKLAVVANDDEGLLAAAEAYSARAPYQWRVPGEKIAAITSDLAPLGYTLAGVTYQHGKADIHSAILSGNAPPSDEAAIAAILASPHLAAVHELVFQSPTTDEVSATGSWQQLGVNQKLEPAQPATPPPAAGATDAANAANAPNADAAGAAPAASARLDLATLYTSRGLFGAAGRIPVPASFNGRLYVPAGAAGIAMANLAARLGLETTGITLPIATPIEPANLRDVRTNAVLAGDSTITQEAERKLKTNDTVSSQSETPLTAGEGELRIVDDAFGRRSAVIARGDDDGAAGALGLLSDRFPNLWEQGKQHLSVEEIRYDLHKFFSLHSSAGQTAAALYHLDHWMRKIDATGIKDVKAEIYTDLADPALSTFVEQQIREQLHTAAAVKTGSLHAGTQCCDRLPDLHYQSPTAQFQPAAPTFAEDIVIPWEGKRLLDTVRAASSKLTAGQPVKLIARVSEGPEQRRKLAAQLKEILTTAGADAAHSTIEVLCAFKQGYSWLVDEIVPALSGKPVASIRIEFAKNIDASSLRTMQSDARWVQEMYPADEMMARRLNLPLEKITLDEIEEPDARTPTYRVRAFDAAGKEILTRDFTVTSVMQPYNGVIPRYEQVQVETGWVRLEAAAKVVLNERIKTDIEEFWDHYQNKTLPRVYQFVMSQVHGDLRAEFSPPFDTLKLDIHLSEPDYNLDLDRERISSLEALQEDTLYSTDVFMTIMGDLETGRPIAYTGRVLPIVHPSEEGQDGHVRIEFYGKPAANPLVRLAWTDAQGKHHKQERNLPALTGEFQPRLIQARTQAGGGGVESLTWLLPADFAADRYDEWLNVEGQDQVDRSIFSAEQARGQMQWLERMHAAGLYRDEVAYPHLGRIAVEFDLPLPLGASVDAPAPREYASFAVTPPVTPRPMISTVKPVSGTPFVQWDEPISPDENTAILARLSTFPGVNVYWMGRTYLGQNIWAADITLPTPALLRSWPKETTLKAAIVYSGRQHANEVSSTSHIDKLAEQLVTDPQQRAMLNKVNVVIHPITNPDGAQLAVDLARITPDNMLHPGYHGALSADVSTGQGETDPIYPESRTRRQLIEAWQPDAFLNPHGYPSHEWVQPFSEYTAWVQSRQGANSGRAWWIPRGWFTSLGYVRDDTHPYSKAIAYALQDRIVEAERNVPGLLALEDRMNSRYQRFGQRWQPRDMYQPIVNGIRIYMSLKGSGGRGGGAAGGDAGAGGAGTPGSGGVTGLSADVTWDAGYTEAPDETAHGDYMKLMASAGLAFDYVHLKYLAEGDLRITRTERDAAGGVTWRIERPRPILPPGTPLPKTTPER